MFLLQFSILTVCQCQEWKSSESKVTSWVKICFYALKIKLKTCIWQVQNWWQIACKNNVGTLLKDGIDSTCACIISEHQIKCASLSHTLEDSRYHNSMYQTFADWSCTADIFITKGKKLPSLATSCTKWIDILMITPSSTHLKQNQATTPARCLSLKNQSKSVLHFFLWSWAVSQRVHNWIDSILTACSLRSQHLSFNKELIWRRLRSLSFEHNVQHQRVGDLDWNPGVQRHPSCMLQATTSITSPRWNHMYSNTQPRCGMWLAHSWHSCWRNHLISTNHWNVRWQSTILSMLRR